MMHSSDEDIELCSIDRFGSIDLKNRKNRFSSTEFGSVRFGSVWFENFFKLDSFTVEYFNIHGFFL